MSCPEIGLHIYKLKTGHMKQKLFQPHYDVAFKSKVIEEYLSTGCTKMSLLRKYNIAFKSAITTWMRVLGYTDTATHVQIPTFGQLTLISLPKKTYQALLRVISKDDCITNIYFATVWFFKSLDQVNKS